MKLEIAARKIDLKRAINVTEIEAESLDLGIGESKDFCLIDIQSYQRIKVRFTRLKSETGRCYITNMNGNDITVTRTKDEKIQR